MPSATDSADFTLTCKHVDGLEVDKTARPHWIQDNTWSVAKTVNGAASASFDLKDGATAAAGGGAAPTGAASAAPVKATVDPATAASKSRLRALGW